MQIIFEDYYLLVLNKPSGVSSENGKDAHPSVEQDALTYFTRQINEKSRSGRVKAEPFLRAAHRLDRPTGGVLVFAKTKTALTHLMAQFEAHETEKTYWAITEKCPPADTGTLANWIAKDPTGRKAIIGEHQSRGSQTCVMKYQVLEKKGDFAFLEIKPLTGRFHQIRAQLSHIGCPIVGDVLYGGNPWLEDRIKLHAHKLSIKHPKNNQVLVFDTWPDWEIPMALRQSKTETPNV